MVPIRSQKSSRGSLWSQWDLHVHTPASIDHHYPGNEEEQWEHFISDVEALPPSFKVLGISDYLFLDGYKRLRQEREDGRMQNIELLLPIVELRLRHFAGTAGHLRKVNAHVLFSDELSPESIEAHFHGAMVSHYKLLLGDEPVEWQGTLTTEGLEELGSRLIEAAPKEKRSGYGSPLWEGFKNITFDLNDILRVLKSTVFRERALVAVGKAEWDQIKWDDGSIADKRDVINRAHFVYVAARDANHHRSCKRVLSAAKVNDTLLDCSDAHYLSTSEEKDRIGNCRTWVNASLSFDGLRHAVIDPDSRVFVGEEPPQLEALRRSPGHFIDSVRIERDPEEAFNETWFDGVELPLNPGLVAVIGNRGTGKSALSEAIAAACNSRVPREFFSFLSEERFNSPRDQKARHFVSAVEMVSGERFRRRLSSLPDPDEAERVVFLPQDFLEVLCSDPTQEREFAEQLAAVVFSHVHEDDRLGKESLGSLVQHLTAESEVEADRLRSRLSQINEAIHSMETQLSEEAVRELRARYAEKRKEVAQHRSRKPAPVAQPTEQPELQALIGETRKELEAVEKRLEAVAISSRQEKLKVAAAETLLQSLNNLQSEVARRLAARDEELRLLNLKASEILEFKPKPGPVEAKLAEANSVLAKLADMVEREDPPGLNAEKGKLSRVLEETQEKLNAPAKAYERYQERLDEWREDRKALIGDPDTPATARYLRARMAAVKTDLPGRLEKLKKDRREHARLIHAEARRLRDAYESLYQPVRQFIAELPAVGQRLKVKLDVAIVAEDLEDRILALIHQGRRGSFQGTKEGRKRLKDLAAKHDFNDADSTVVFAQALERMLHFDVGVTPAEPRSISDQVMDGHSVPELLDLIFGLDYLRPEYQIFVGDSRLSALSPGERGLTLLAFYLLISKDDRPVIIDQPEGNLDNESVFEHLVPCVREAKKCRQIIIVTHNPNLAVVCDAEQVVRADLNKDENYRATYISGAIEDPKINKWLVDVLEGTWPAFTLRRKRYRPSG